MDVHERRRLALATAFTLVALPAIWLFDRDDPTATPNVAAAGVPALEPAVPSVAATTEPEAPIFLDNTVAVVAPAVIDIALPDPPGDDEATGDASYRRFVEPPTPRPCATPLAPSGAVVTVTNVDNGLSTTCVNTLGVSTPPATVIAIDTDVFTEIADLVDAPVPVRISW